MRRIRVAAAAFVIVSASVMQTSTAHATTAAVTVTCVSGQLQLSPSMVAADANDTINVTNSTGGTTIAMGAHTNVTAVGSGNILTGTNQNFTVTGSSGGSLEFAPGQGAGGSCGAAVSATLLVTGSGGGGGGGGTHSEAPAPVPVLATLTVEVGGGSATCTGGDPVGLSGTWLKLPSADACSPGASASPQAVLLGWATTSTFPRAVAERQLKAGWGTFDGDIDGTRMIFIPAGGYAFVSGSNTLYPIWSA